MDVDRRKPGFKNVTVQAGFRSVDSLCLAQKLEIKRRMKLCLSSGNLPLLKNLLTAESWLTAAALAAGRGADPKWQMSEGGS